MNSVMVRVLYGNVVTERKYDVNYRILLVIFMRFFLTLDWFLDTFMSHHILFCRGTSLTFGNCMQWKESKNDDKYLLEKVCSERKEKMIIDMNIYLSVLHTIKNELFSLMHFIFKYRRYGLRALDIQIGYNRIWFINIRYFALYKILFS